MKIVIPTAGLGTRLRPLTWSRPKPLLRVADQPVLGHVLDMFAALDRVDEIVFIVGYLGDQIERYVKQAYPDLNSRFVVQEEMRGQSHAIWLAREGLHGPMLMAFVDTLIETDLAILNQDGLEAAAWVKEVEDPRRFGVAVLGDDGFVERIVEKPADTSNNLAVVGFYYFHEAEHLIDAIERQMDRGTQLGGEYYLADAINVMLEEGLRMQIERVGTWVDCGKPDALLETNQHLLKHGRDNSAAAHRAGVKIHPPVYIHPGAVIENSIIGPNVAIGDGCSIHRAVVQNAIIDDRSRIEAVTIADSIIGRDVNIIGREQTLSLNIGDSSEIIIE
jgi:glucose-1-phosphate thymidylyltransferase